MPFIATAPRTRTRPDMEWLLRLVGRLEARPAVRRELRVFANPAVLQHGDRAYRGEAIAVLAPVREVPLEDDPSTVRRPHRP